MSDIDIKIVSIFEKINQIQRSLMWEVAKKEKLSPVQIQFLLFIGKSPSELCKVSVIAKEFDLTKATVSDAVSTLDSKELLKKIRNEKDKRYYILELTQKGKRVVKRISRWSDIIISQLSSFPQDEKEKVLLFLMELVKFLFDKGAISVPRLCIACNNFQKNAEPSSHRPHRCNLTGKSISDTELNFGCTNYTVLDH